MCIKVFVEIHAKNPAIQLISKFFMNNSFVTTCKIWHTKNFSFHSIKNKLLWSHCSSHWYDGSSVVTDSVLQDEFQVCSSDKKPFYLQYGIKENLNKKDSDKTESFLLLPQILMKI